MATFMEKEAAIELLNGIVGTIARTSNLLEFKENNDRKIVHALINEIRATDYSKLDYQVIKDKINEIEAPYVQIEKALITIRNRHRDDLIA